MIPVARPVITNDEIEAAIRVLESGMYTSGKEVEKFEEEFAAYIGTKYAVACNSGTAALHLSLASRYLGEDEVLVPSMSFFATVSSVMMAGYIPIFVDVDDRGNMDPEDLERKITSRSSAVIPVHLYGHPCDMDKIVDITNRYNLTLIEDCAQAHGAEFKQQKVGSFGEMGCFSFFATKNMTTIEGGMITTNDEEVTKFCKMMRSHGMSDRNTHLILGYNYRMNELSAAIGRVQLKRLDLLNKLRVVNSTYLLGNIEDKDWFKLYYPEPNKKDVYFWFPIYCEFPEKFSKHLKDNGIGFRFRYNEPLYKQLCLPSHYYKVYCPTAEKLSGKMFGLPNYSALSIEELDQVIDVVNSFRP